MSSITVYLAYFLDREYPQSYARNCFSSEQLAIEYLFPLVVEVVEDLPYENLDILAQGRWKNCIEYDEHLDRYLVKRDLRETKRNLILLLDLLNEELGVNDYTVIIEPIILDSPSDVDVQQREDEFSILSES